MSVTPAEVRAKAQILGFTACGIADLSPSVRGEALDEWLAKGYAGTMRYLHRQAVKRKLPGTIVDGALVAIVVLDNYFPEKPTPPGVRIAKYAWGDDYHEVLAARLDQLGAWLKSHGAIVARHFVDAGPVPERELAQRAGLGWIGKNTMLIRPMTGSFFFIGSVFTDLALTPDRAFQTDHCGTCTRCLDACPTEALVEPRVLDATRCISYLTIEQRDPIPEDRSKRFQGWAFGCDICNDVCPWNERFAVPTGIDQFRRPPRIDLQDAGVFDRIDEPEFERRFGRTPMERPGLEGMRRNWRAAFASLETAGEAGRPSLVRSTSDRTNP